MKKKIWGFVAFVVIATVLSACSNYKFKPTINYEIEDFDHVNHRNEQVSLDSLKGKPWLGMFIFTNCKTVCSPMTFNMTQIQKELVKRGVEDYNIVAFSVDPDVDTPKALSEYLSRYDVPDESKWNLLTGYNQKYIEQFALESFKTLVKDDPTSDQVVHGVTFFLVDKNGVAVKSYSGYSETEGGVPIQTIATDVETYIEEMNK